MMIKAMEVSGIEGNFRTTCEAVLKVLRTHKDSLMVRGGRGTDGVQHTSTCKDNGWCFWKTRAWGRGVHVGVQGR